MSEQKDFIDVMMRPEGDAASDEERCNGLVVFERAKSSDELEERERAYLESMNHPELLDGCALWPVPFFDEVGNLEPLGKIEREALLDTFGIDEATYRTLYEDDVP